MEGTLGCFHGMAVEPAPLEDFIAVLQVGRKSKNLDRAKYLHVQLCGNGLETQCVLGSFLIPMFVGCGGLTDAQQAFCKLGHRDEYSWTSLIQGYIECGEFHHAFNLYSEMQEDGVHPSKHTYLALLKACASLKCADRGQEVHADLAKDGFEKDPVVGTTLVDMYAKCGALAKAEEMFGKLQVRDVVSWTALIGGYVEQGLSEEALDCFKQMQTEGTFPNAVTYVCSLKACGSLEDLERGREIHAEIAKEGFERDLYLGNTLVDMYGKSGSLSEAREVFEELLVRDVVSWNALIAGYSEHRLDKEALDCLDEMQLDGICPTNVTFICSLKACGGIGAIERGLEIHAEIAMAGLEVDDYVGNTLVYMYAKCGLLVEAWDVFDELPVRDIVSWNALITVYSERGQGEEALRCLEQLQMDHVSPIAATYVCSLKACDGLGATGMGRQIHSEIVRRGFEKELFVGNTLVDMYAKCGLLLEARKSFDALHVPDVVSWNALISGYVQHRLGEEAWNCLKQMQLKGIAPNAITFFGSLKACCSKEGIERGQEIHSEISKEGFEKDFFVGTTLVDMYAQWGLLAEAQAVFDELLVRDMVAWTALITGYAQNGHSEEALKCLEKMQCEGTSPGVMSWNPVILGFVEQGEAERASMLCLQMQEQGISPDNVTFVSILKACGNTTAGEMGRKIHARIHRACDQDAIGLVIETALLDMYGKCGSMDDAQQVFSAMPTRDLVGWSSLIMGYSRQGESKLVFHLFERMREEGVQPDEIAFLSVLNACSHVGDVERGLTYLEAMSRAYCLTPNIMHYNCMIDLLGRANQLDEAVAMLKTMPLKPNLATWSSLLGASQKWGNVEVGRHAFKHVVRLGGICAGPFIVMSNIYADAHMWEDAKKIEAMRVNIQARKEPEGSWCEINGFVRAFIVPPGRHPQSKEICAKSKQVGMKVEEEYVLDSESMLLGSFDLTEEVELCRHTEMLAIMCAVENTLEGTPIHVVKNFCVCDYCHTSMAQISKVEQRTTICRDASCLHVFKDGKCSCSHAN